MLTYKSALTSIFFSIFIYFEYFDISNIYINTIVGLVAYLLLFTLNKKELFASGFMVGVLWFWWLGHSFVYYDLKYLIPLVIIAIGLLYGVLFYFISAINHSLYKIVYILILSFFEPFGFNWFKFELLFVDSLIGISKVELFVVLISSAFLVFLITNKKRKIYLIFYPLAIVTLVLLNKPIGTKIQDNLKIKLLQTDIDQDKKWNREFTNSIINKNLKLIDNAIEENYDLIIFPETAFPVVLNHNEKLNALLLEKSKNISILLGALYEKDQLYYNSSYLYQDLKVEVAHKVVLVPFGEAVPLPEKIRDFINDLFYNGAKDYETAKDPTTFDIKGEKFRNAICYEATTDKIYENLDTKNVIAISNNAWFTPSSQPALQRLLLKYYSLKYGVIIYNVTNKSKSGIIN